RKHASIATLSGGERNRVLLAKLLCRDGNVLILDEPTNDLDLMTLRALEEALIAFPGVVLVVSHDRFFLDRVATRILYLDGEGGHRVHEGDLSLLLERLAKERQRATLPPRAAADPPPGPPPAARPQQARATAPRLSTRERAELEAPP